MRALIWLAAFCISTPALTQELPPSSPSSPRLGLVLGGGGARGFAHVGVLQVLEENRIPVHAISGTSMGAVVGSLYASGNDATRITEIARTIPWSTVFNDKIERNRMPFRRKRDERDVLVDYRISFDDKGLVLPQGVLRGQELFLTLAEYLAPARGTTNFNNLATPFKAVATDIETGTPVVMENGDIVTAVFASMAVPGGLPPVLRDDKLLVDGAIVDNLPIDVGRSMGVDHVIVVNVSTPLQSRDKLQSFVAILSQIQSMLGRESEQRQLETLNDADVLIEPHQPDISTTSFNKAEEGIASGRAAALAVVDKLRRYSLSPEAWQRYVAARDGKAPDRNPVVHFVKIDNDSEIPDRVVDEMITTQAGQRLNAAAMTNDLQDVYALGAFRSVRYTMDRDPDTQNLGVTVKTDPDPTAANWIQLGLGLSSDFNRSTKLNLGLAFTDRNFLNSGLEWRTDLRVGTNVLLQTSLYREFSNANLSSKAATRPFVELTPYWSRQDSLLFTDGDALSKVRESRVGARAEGGIVIGTWGEMRIGADISSVDLDTIVGSDRGERSPLDGTRLTDLALTAAFTLDTLDNLSFPTKGTLLHLRAEHHNRLIGGDIGYQSYWADIWKPFSFGRTTFVASGQFGYSGHGINEQLADFRLGGFLKLSGTDEQELMGRHMMLGRAIIYHRLFEEAPIMNVPVYLGGSFELGNAWNDKADIAFDNLRPAGSLFAGADTPLGPFILAAGLTRGNAAFYLILGRFF